MQSKIIGLTGNTGSGKSKVAEVLKANGAVIIDADSIAHEIMLPQKPAYFELTNYFDEILTDQGLIDRKKLAAIVFSNEKERRKLIEITHKYIVKEMLERLDNSVKNIINCSGVVLDAPLLIEAGLHKYVNQVWLVHADGDIRHQRIMARDGIDSQQAYLRMQVQTPFEELKKYANIIIENMGTTEELEQKIKELYMQAES